MITNVKLKARGLLLSLKTVTRTLIYQASANTEKITGKLDYPSHPSNVLSIK